jgi:hypothetical protein
MKKETMTPEQIRVAGLAALADALGPVGMIRFLQQIEAGYGDYGTDRHTWLEETDVRTLAAKIRERRSSEKGQPD